MDTKLWKTTMKLEHDLQEQIGKLEVKFEIGGDGVEVRCRSDYPVVKVPWQDVPALIMMLRSAQEEDGRTVT